VKREQGSLAKVKRNDVHSLSNFRKIFEKFARQISEKNNEARNIQKVSAELELQKPPAQTVVNNQ
jgi:hypothetical protein